MHTSPTATPLAPNFWTDKIQNCLHVLQCNHRFHSLLSFWAATLTFTVLPALSALRQTHTRSKSNTSTTKPMAFALSHTGPHIWNNLPQDIGHSATLFLQKPTQDIYLLRIFQLNHIVLHSCQSVQCVCVCACQCIFCIIRVEHLSIYTFFNFKKINKIFHLDVHYACSALWAAGQALYKFPLLLWDTEV